MNRREVLIGTVAVGAVPFLPKIAEAKAGAAKSSMAPMQFLSNPPDSWMSIGYERIIGSYDTIEVNITSDEFDIVEKFWSGETITMRINDEDFQMYVVDVTVEQGFKQKPVVHYTLRNVA